MFDGSFLSGIASESLVHILASDCIERCLLTLIPISMFCWIIKDQWSQSALGFDECSIVVCTGGWPLTVSWNSQHWQTSVWYRLCQGLLGKEGSIDVSLVVSRPLTKLLPFAYISSATFDLRSFYVLRTICEFIVICAHFITLFPHLMVFNLIHMCEYNYCNRTETKWKVVCVILHF